ncbi:GCN5 family acetyltransferase [Streptomyces eurocidicus]|uniref:GCN5 family acetyltransferase n=1 Tax=Streptomyces eurocidicus TaxID=66423 RepID=A0A2N8P0X0_STREU|nr:GNAT family N-acetyltransferase [Streptomyces eurocidicus]MBB5121765.1 ribosomal protein S18 acetylase RimI-like enzyme [Streptomyces eurocidicus]MBF6055033.1 GNAT family N-acetyltransferase [Streptomyces eurocidicus]PNE34649.1 GCN5 family acetyltransferase [Streptomyces eurocidicus]
MHTPTIEPAYRAATTTDVPGLVALIESAYRGDASRTGWTTEADLLGGQRTDAEGIEAIVGDPANRLLMAEHHGALIACCQLEHHGDHAYFGMFAVRPDLQRGGIGKLLIAEAERIARAEWRMSEMRMTVIKQRAELISWYERRGYRRTGSMSPFPYGDERFGIPRRPDLEFELLIKTLG